MIQDLWLVLTRRLTQRKLDLCDALCLRLAHDLQAQKALIKALRQELGYPNPSDQSEPRPTLN
jgi:hypothetical protein